MKKLFSQKSNKTLSYLFLLVLFIGFGLSACKTTSKEELSHAADRTSRMVMPDVTNWASTNGMEMPEGEILLAATTISNNIKMGTTSQLAIDTIGAWTFLKTIHDQGNLPGINKDEHGYETSDSITAVSSNKLIQATYPTSRTFHFVKDGETSTNNYMVVKETADNEWRLQRAWETDSNGQIIKEWKMQ